MINKKSLHDAIDSLYANLWVSLVESDTSRMLTVVRVYDIGEEMMINRLLQYETEIWDAYDI
jgi:hypothetical protein